MELEIKEKAQCEAAQCCKSDCLVYGC